MFRENHSGGALTKIVEVKYIVWCNPWWEDGRKDGSCVRAMNSDEITKDPLIMLTIDILLSLRTKILHCMTDKYANKSFFRPDVNRDAEYYCKQTLCYIVRTSRLLQMQLSDEAYDIIGLSYISVKLVKRLNVERSYGNSASGVVKVPSLWETWAISKLSWGWVKKGQRWVGNAAV